MNLSSQINFIESYQFPPEIILRLKKEFNYSDFQLSFLIESLKDYFLCHLLRKHSSNSFFLTLPSFHVDQVWHWFILFTPIYRDFCDKAFGSYLDHIPTTGVVPTKTHKDESYFNTLRFLQQVKTFRKYQFVDFIKLNSIDSFYSLFSVDYMIQGFSYSASIEKSLFDLDFI